jgi:DNA-directed RNA polymerase specialized sigma24 family protein
MIDQVMDDLSPKHREVIDLHVFGGFTAAEVCDRVEDMTEDNVAQIASRFRAKLRARLQSSKGGAS